MWETSRACVTSTADVEKNVIFLEIQPLSNFACKLGNKTCRVLVIL